MEKYGQETPPEIDISKIETVPICMFVGVQDQIVDVESNRWVKDQLKSLIFYKELEHDHFSFQLAKDMSYFDEVIELIEKHNPVPAGLAKKPERISQDKGIIYEPEIA